jgi:hypothetical protein
MGKPHEKQTLRKSLHFKHNIVTHMPIARQRFGKHIPEITLSTIEGYILLGNGPINTH